MRFFRLLLSLVAAISSSVTAFAQNPSTRIGKACDVAVFGENSTKGFLEFDHVLREALKHDDTARLALLVQYPLNVFDGRGGIQIATPAGLQGHYRQIFPQAIRDAILSSSMNDVWCNYTGITYKDVGSVWINVTDKGFFLMTINLPDKHDPGINPPTLELACHTKTDSIVIDQTGKDLLRLRIWLEGVSIAAKPSTVIVGGQGRFEGTGPCSAKVWEFSKRNKKYQFSSTDGCYGESAPPRDAKAGFTETTKDGDKRTEWCF